MASRDLYSILGVDRRASQEDIKQAYRRLAREAHPDVRRDDPHATDRFKEINEAYAVLSDPAQRTHYDRYGEVGGDLGSFGRDASPFGDLFDLFFGGRGGVRTAEREAPARGADLRYDLEITLEEVSTGVEKPISLERLETCASCFGTGAERGSKPERCPSCDGTGEVRHAARTVFGHFTQIGTCPQCRGTGTFIAKPCGSCRGSGQTEARREITVSVPAGVEEGMHLRLSGEGEAGSRGGSRGDLFVVIHIARHDTFRRRGRDLIREAEITMVQAALGDEIRLAALDGEAVLTVPPGTQPGTTLTIRGRGLPELHRGRGDLHVTVRVAVPRRLSAEQRALLEEFGRTSGERRPKKRGSVLKSVKNLLQ
ncbi:MAG: molecular chaperone DnaJ [Armatimonadota bacterium]